MFVVTDIQVRTSSCLLVSSCTSKPPLVSKQNFHETLNVLQTHRHTHTNVRAHIFFMRLMSRILKICSAPLKAIIWLNFYLSYERGKQESSGQLSTHEQDVVGKRMSVSEPYSPWYSTAQKIALCSQTTSTKFSISVPEIIHLCSQTSFSLFSEFNGWGWTVKPRARYVCEREKERRLTNTGEEKK